MAKNIKKRNWAFVLYPESAPADWREQLQKTGLQCAISPLHDKDMNPDNTPKKPHYHVILTYSGPTSYNVVKEQAKAYTANRDEIGELRERSAAVSRREQRADQREQLLDNKANELARQQQQLQQMYQRQLNLNQLLEKSEQDGRAKDKQIADLQTENASLRGQIRSLTAQMDEIKAELWDKINNLRDKLRGAYESLTNVVKAVGMLKYDREKDQNGNYTYGKYGISNLSKAQEKLIDGLAEYGAKWAKEDGFPEMAEGIEKQKNICYIF